MDLCGTHLTACVDAAARRRVFERDEGVCQDRTIRPHVCAGSLQWAHLISRSYRGVRWLADNGVVLCAGAHQFYTTRPLEWERWCVARLGQDSWDELRAIALEFASGRAKIDLQETARAFGIIDAATARAVFDLAA